VHGTLNFKKDTKIYCYDNPSTPSPLDIWKPVKVEISADPSIWLSVISAATDDLHSVVDNFIQTKLGTIDEKEALEERLMKKGTRGILPTLSFLSGCPPAWAADRSTCSMWLSPFGRSCIAVKGRMQEKGAKEFTINTSSGFERRLVVRLVVGLVLMLLAQPFSKSKMFQYSIGTLLGLAAGVMMIVMFLLGAHKANRAKLMSLPLVLGGWFSIIYFWAKVYFVEVMSNYWEWLMLYMVVSASIGLYCTYRIRADPDSKHRTRVVVKWIIRGIGFYFIYISTFSWYIEAALFAFLLLWYLVYKIKKATQKTKKKGV